MDCTQTERRKMVTNPEEEFEARLELARLLQADAQVRIDRLAAAGTQKELERAFRVNALARPTKV